MVRAAAEKKRKKIEDKNLAKEWCNSAISRAAEGQASVFFRQIIISYFTVLCAGEVGVEL